ncbi:MAG: hypothetical protein ACRYFU_04725 [Janthinobacterium lividum]
MPSLPATDLMCRAQDHLRCLIYGLDPRTQKPISDISVLTDAQILRSLVFALEVIEQRVEPRPEEKEEGRRAGAPWSRAEDEKLLTHLRAGAKLAELTLSHERAQGGIVSRLVKLEEISSKRETRAVFKSRRKQLS